MKTYQFGSIFLVVIAIFADRYASYSGIDGVVMTSTSMDPVAVVLGFTGTVIGVVGFANEFLKDKPTKDKPTEE